MVTLAGFLAFIRGNMGISTTDLPDNAPVILMALAISEETVNPALRAVRSPAFSSLGYTGPNIYELAVYNLGGDNIINFAPDQPDSTFFAVARTGYGCNSFVAGVIASSADETTSESLVVPDFMKQLTLSNLQQLKTPWGRQYLAFAQDYGNIWGIS
jgi:hypothetical protein